MFASLLFFLYFSFEHFFPCGLLSFLFVNKVCFRCQRSGHLSKDCPPRRWGRLCFCALCGDTHDSSECSRDMIASMASLDHGAQCLTCRNTHAPFLLCKTSVIQEESPVGLILAPNSVEPRLWCAVCGEGGHEHSGCRGEGNDEPQRKRSRPAFSSPGQADGAGPSRGADVKCYGCNGIGHISRDCPKSRTSPHSSRTREVQCNTCSMFGHIARDCRLSAQKLPKQNSGRRGTNLGPSAFLSRFVNR